MRKIKENRTYPHFRGKLYRVLHSATHTETEELLASEVDHEKCPDVQQKYRFELVAE